MTDDAHQNLTAAMLSRSSDLAQFMANRGIRAHMAVGAGKAGESCVVVIATGFATGPAEEMGRMLIDYVATLVAESGRN